MRKLRIGYALLVMLPAAMSNLPAVAAEVRAVQVQSPAWLERAGQRSPLIAGVELVAGDRVISGEGGRVRLAIADGGQVRLGQATRFEIDAVAADPAEDGLLRGLFSLDAGVFRYTTGAAATEALRDLHFRVGAVAVAVAVRGGDVWGRAGPDHDLVCLLDGQVEIAALEDARVFLSDSRSVYSLPRDGEADPVIRIQHAQLAEWVAETETGQGAGLSAADGRWRVHLVSSRSRENAMALRGRIRAAGYPVELQRIEIEGAPWWRILLPGLVSEADARAAGARVAAIAGTAEPWVSRF